MIVMLLFSMAAFSQGDYKLLKSNGQNIHQYKVNDSEVKKLHKEQPEYFYLQMPKHGYQLELYKIEVVTPDFVVTDESNVGVAYEKPLTYKGFVVGKANTFAALNVNQDGTIYGVIEDGNDSYTIGGTEKRVKVLNESLMSVPQAPMFEGDQLQIPDGERAPDSYFKATPTPPSYLNQCKKIRVYFECSNKLYKDQKSSTQAVADYVVGLFSVVAILYDNIDVHVEISQIKIWTNDDPYSYGSSTQALFGFRDRMKNGFNGDLAHLLSTENAGLGGVAYVNALCASNGFRTAFSNISNSYNQFPTYSWTVNVVAHELGHNLGSPHTQSCTWAGGALDDCYATEGNCPPGPKPFGGGTIMSYCHLTSSGVSFTKGFHPQVTQKIKNTIASASCIQSEDCDDDGGGGGGDEQQPNLTRKTDFLQFDGEVIVGNVKVTNTGDKSSPSSQIAFYLSKDNKIAANDIRIGVSQIEGIAKGAERNVSFAWTPKVEEGDYFVGYVIDYLDVVEESNEEDNAYRWNNKYVVTGSDEYCKSEGQSSSFEAINSVKFNLFKNKSGDDDGYGDYTDLPLNMQKGQRVDVILEPLYSGSQQFVEEWYIWIDWNGDKDFQDEGEMVLTVRGRGIQEGKFTVPTNISVSKTRMRVQMYYRSSKDFALTGCSVYPYGEVEDYTISFDGVQSCGVPEIKTIDINFEAKQATVNWAALPDATLYYVQWKKVGDERWTTNFVSAPNFILKGATEFEYRIRADCNPEYGIIHTLKYK